MNGESGGAVSRLDGLRAAVREQHYADESAVVESEALTNSAAWMRRLVSRLGEPVVRRAMLQAMRIVGRQFVLGRDIEEAMRHTQRSHRLHGVGACGEVPKLHQ